ncbi:MAG TPA: tetratricopeptide repeat protein [Bacteroidota bacterium]|nr:tetratricopeptide repeat protein [Bacteroidota bacterium]
MKKYESLDARHYFCAIAIAGILLYGKTVFFEFTYADDTQLIVVNSEFLSNLSNIPKLFSRDVFISMPNTAVFFRPLLNLSLMIDASIGGTSPWMYHITNLLLHIGCSMLLFLVLHQLGRRKIVAGIVALFFTVHPLLTSAVAWIPGRNDSLMTFFILLSFLFFLKWITRDDTFHLTLHLVFFFLALLTKESAVVFPLFPLAYALFPAPKRVKRTKLMIPLAGWAVLIGTWLILRSNVLQTYEISRNVEATALSGISKLPAFLLYLGKAVFPFNLSVFPNLSDDTLLWGFLALVALLAGFIRHKRHDAKLAMFGLAWFTLFLLPTFLTGSILHEHRAYCSIVGFSLVISELPFWKQLDLSKKTTIGFVGGIVLLFGTISFAHSENFRNRQSYSTNVFTRSPSLDESITSMAGMLIDRGDTTAAERVLLQGISKNPNVGIARRMLADLYASRGEFEKAEREYLFALELDPLHLYTYVNYGKMCLNQGRLEDAERLWRQTVAVNPDFILGYYLLANFSLLNRDDPETARLYTREIEKRGVRVMPELLSRIANHPKSRSVPNGGSTDEEPSQKSSDRSK